MDGEDDVNEIGDVDDVGNVGVVDDVGDVNDVYMIQAMQVHDEDDLNYVNETKQRVGTFLYKEPSEELSNQNSQVLFVNFWL